MTEPNNPVSVTEIAEEGSKQLADWIWEAFAMRIDKPLSKEKLKNVFLAAITRALADKDKEIAELKETLGGHFTDKTLSKSGWYWFEVGSRQRMIEIVDNDGTFDEEVETLGTFPMMPGDYFGPINVDALVKLSTPAVTTEKEK